jgi:hypothetical protein
VKIAGFNNHKVASKTFVEQRANDQMGEYVESNANAVGTCNAPTAEPDLPIPAPQYHMSK